MTDEKQKPRATKKYLLIVAVLAIAAVVFGTTLRQTGKVQGSISDSTLFKAKRGPLTISVLEKGTIKARQQEVIKSQVYGVTTILSLVAEGTRVKKGDLLVQLDASAVKNDVAEREIQAENAKATWSNAKENLAVVRNQAQSDVDAAKLTLRFAEEDLKKYIEGDFPKLVKEAETNIKLAETTLRRAQDTLQGSRRLLEEKFLTPVEFSNDESAEESARLGLELRKADLQLLQDYTYTRQIAQLESNVVEARRAFERAEIKARSDVVQAESNLRTQESDYRQRTDRLERERQRLVNSTIYAPTDGLVVYATTGKGSWRGRDEPMEEGRTIREREEIIHLPTADAMMAEVGVHESNLSKVKIGQVAEITIEALPGRVFTGIVKKISPMPDAMSAFLTPDLKIYLTEIHLDGDGSELRTGMTCSSEIIVEQHDVATYVPVQSVIRVGNQHTVYVKEQDELVARNVSIGLDNNRMIHIKDGLQVDEEVSMTPPLQDAAQFRSDNEKVAVTPQENVTATPGRSEGRRGAPGKAGAPGGPSGTKPSYAPKGDAPKKGFSPPDGAGAGGTSPFENMSREERRNMFENMSDENRQKMRDQFGGGRGGGRGGAREGGRSRGGREGGPPRAEGRPAETPPQ